MKYLRYFIILFFFNILFLNYSPAIELPQSDFSPLEQIIINRDIYKYKENEKHLAHSVVSVFNKEVNGYGTGFFISPHWLATDFHVVCCFETPVDQTLFITTIEGQTIAIDNIIYANAFDDLAILEVRTFTSKYFLELNKNTDIQTDDKIRVLGYTKDHSNLIRLTGKIDQQESDLYNSIYTGSVNFYKLKGTSGAPVFHENNDKVIGIVSNSSSSIVNIIPDWQLNTAIKAKKYCQEWQSCQLNTLKTLIALAEKEGNAQAQYILGLLSSSSGFGLNELIWWYSAAQSGHKFAMLNVGIALVNNGIAKENEQDLAAGMEWLKKAVEKGVISASFLLADITLHILGKEEKVEEYLFYAASRGHTTAQLDLGDFYLEQYKKIGSMDEKKKYKDLIFKWYNQADKNGHPEAAGRMLTF